MIVTVSGWDGRHPILSSLAGDAVIQLRRGLARLLARSPADRLAASALSALTRRFRDFRPVTSLAHHLGDMWVDGPIWGRLPTGSEILLNLRDHQHRQIYFYGCYEPETTALVRRLLRPGLGFVDVGANVGYYSLLAHDLGAAVLAFEPNPEIFRLLSKSVASTSGSARLDLQSAACGAAPGRATLHVSGDAGNSGLSSLHPREASGVKVEVSVTTLDDRCGCSGIRPDVVKIDTEGYGLEVLRGMENLLEARVPQAVICEVTPQGRVDPPVLVEFMERFGYSCRRIAADGSLISCAGEFQVLENVCFVPCAGERQFSLPSCTPGDRR